MFIEGSEAESSNRDTQKRNRSRYSRWQMTSVFELAWSCFQCSRMKMGCMNSMRWRERCVSPNQTNAADAPGARLICSVRRYGTMGKAGLFICVSALLVVTACSEQFSPLDKEPWLSSVETGSDVVDAIEAYRLDSGDYPVALDALVPRYLADVPRPQVYGNADGQYYYTTHGQGFRISFRAERPIAYLWPSRSMRFFLYRSEQRYGGAKEDVHFIHDGWAYVTLNRHRVGEGGRVQ